jgi:hypothetical protein
VRLAARRVAEAKADRAAHSGPVGRAPRRGLEDAEELAKAAQRGMVVPEGPVASGSAATAARALRAWADQVQVARDRPVTAVPGDAGVSAAAPRAQAAG